MSHTTNPAHEATSEGQALRLAELRGKVLVFVTPGYASKRFIYERAAALGVRAVVVDSPDSWARALEAEGVLAKFVGVNMDQAEDELFDDISSELRALALDEDVGAVDGVCSFSELMVPLATRLAGHLGLPGPTRAAVDVARDKYKTRAAMVVAGIPTPANALVRTLADVKEAAVTVGFPAVLKPISGAASLGVKKVGSHAELRQAFLEVQDEMRNTVVTSGAIARTKAPSGVSSHSCASATSDDDSEEALIPLSGSEDSDMVLNAGHGGGGAKEETVFMLEQYLDGPEVDVDVVVSEGEARYCEVVDNGPTAEPYFNETWGLCPSKLPHAQQRDLQAMAIDSLKACGFDAGVFHVELKVTSKGPRLIEINARMGGGQVRDTHLRVWGVDLVDETLLVTAGVPAHPPRAQQPLCALAYNYVSAPASGRVAHTDALSRLSERDDVVYARALVQPGDEVVGPKEGMPSWVADVMIARQTSEEALETVLKVCDAVEVPVDSMDDEVVLASH